MSIGSAVRELREAQGISQQELATKAQIHRSYLSRVEREAGNVPRLDIHALLRIAGALDVTLEEILLQAGLIPAQDPETELRAQHMLRLFRDLPAERQEELLLIAKTLQGLDESVEG